jgi:hypothetical protein
MLIETPLIQEIVAEARQEGRAQAILDCLTARFGAVTPTITTGLAQVKEREKLLRLTQHAVLCPSLRAFENSLRKESSAPPPASTRGKRRSRKPPA